MDVRECVRPSVWTRNSICMDGLQNEFAQFFSLMSKSAIFKFYSRRPKAKGQGQADSTSCLEQLKNLFCTSKHIKSVMS